MYNNALIGEGNIIRLANAMKKAEAGGGITVGAIGGSITEGCSASSPEHGYAERFKRWWEEKFPDAAVNYVNAAIGGTDSYLGVHRVDEHLLSSSPDVVVVEFSVNDTDESLNKYSYDSLLRKILLSKSSPAVIMLFTMTDDGFSMQDVHKEIGKFYDLPMLSYRDAVFFKINGGELKWSDISPDEVHPNDKGHEIIARLLTTYLDDVYSKREDVREASAAFSADAYTDDFYEHAALYNAERLPAVRQRGFEVADNGFYPQFPRNWITKRGGEIAFEFECRNFGIFYLRTTDGKSGVFDVYIDGKKAGLIEADFTGGWGDYGFSRQYLTGDGVMKHTAEIKPAPGSEEKGLTILALMIS